MAIDPDYGDQLRTAVAAQVPKVVPAADTGRLDGLNAAVGIHAAQHMALSIGRGRAAAKYGAGSDQVRALDGRLTAVAVSANAVSTARERALVTPPTLPANSAGVFGRVVGADGTGLVGATVEAFGPHAAPIRHVTTGDGGAYQLVLSVPRLPAARTQTGKGQASASQTRGAQTSRAQASRSEMTRGETSRGETGRGAGGRERQTGEEAAAPAPPATATATATLSVTLRATAAGETPLIGTEVLTLHDGDILFRELTMTAANPGYSATQTAKE